MGFFVNHDASRDKGGWGLTESESKSKAPITLMLPRAFGSFYCCLYLYAEFKARLQHFQSQVVMPLTKPHKYSPYLYLVYIFPRLSLLLRPNLIGVRAARVGRWHMTCPVHLVHLVPISCPSRVAIYFAADVSTNTISSGLRHDRNRRGHL